MSEPFIAEIRIFAGNFAPRGWAFCDGQLLPISQNTALFSLIGTTYGGDGRTTFALPDLRGRAPIHAGNGPGLTNRQLGSKAGVETVALSESQMPGHAHAVGCSNGGSSAAFSTTVSGQPKRRLADSATARRFARSCLPQIRLVGAEIRASSSCGIAGTPSSLMSVRIAVFRLDERALSSE